MTDLLLRGGRIMDPRESLDCIADIRFAHVSNSVQLTSAIWSDRLASSLRMSLDLQYGPSKNGSQQGCWQRQEIGQWALKAQR